MGAGDGRAEENIQQQGGGKNVFKICAGGAVEADLDKLGRILIPDYLKQYAGLKKIRLFADFRTNWKFGILKDGPGTKQTMSRTLIS